MKSQGTSEQKIVIKTHGDKHPYFYELARGEDSGDWSLSVFRQKESDETAVPTSIINVDEVTDLSKLLKKENPDQKSIKEKLINYENQLLLDFAAAIVKISDDTDTISDAEYAKKIIQYYFLSEFQATLNSPLKLEHAKKQDKDKLKQFQQELATTGKLANCQNLISLDNADKETIYACMMAAENNISTFLRVYFVNQAGNPLICTEAIFHTITQESVTFLKNFSNLENLNGLMSSEKRKLSLSDKKPVSFIRESEKINFQLSTEYDFLTQLNTIKQENDYSESKILISGADIALLTNGNSNNFHSCNALERLLTKKQLTNQYSFKKTETHQPPDGKTIDSCLADIQTNLSDYFEETIYVTYTSPNIQSLTQYYAVTKLEIRKIDQRPDADATFSLLAADGIRDNEILFFPLISKSFKPKPEPSVFAAVISYLVASLTNMPNQIGTFLFSAAKEKNKSATESNNQKGTSFSYSFFSKLTWDKVITSISPSSSPMNSPRGGSTG